MTVKTGSGIEVFGKSRTVGELLGAGGEGQVFALSEQGHERPLALKWYHQNVASRSRRSSIGELVNRGSPNESFLWPLGVVEGATSNEFGYVMDLRPEGYIGLSMLLRGKIPRNEAAVARFAFELSMAFRALHLRGLCYRDINFGNAFMHRESGAALICDNDNVCVDGVGEAQVLGSRKFMAPEIVRRQALPSKFTDRFSLAVMLFYLLVVHHPLEGELTETGLTDAQSDMRHFGTDPVFCFDPVQTSNRPHPDFHSHADGLWGNLPSSIRDLFTRSFTVGLYEPAKRVVDSEWCSSLADLRSGLHLCTTCGVALNLATKATHCQQCSTEIGPVVVMEVGTHPQRQIVAASGAQITEHHTEGTLNFEKVFASVEAHPTDPGRLGLRNDTATPAEIRTPSGEVHAVPPGRRSDLLPGAVITFREPSFVVRVTKVSNTTSAEAE